jgi:hypothetical protein
MPTINQLASLNQLSGSDQIPVYSASNGDARKASISTLLTYIEQAWMSPAFERVTASPTLSGFTLTLPTGANSLFVLLTPTGTMATGTIVLPPAASAADGQEIVLFTSQEVTALTFTLNGATAVGGAPTGIQAGASLTLRYDVLSVAWYTTEKPTSVGSGTVDFLPKWTAPTTLANSIVRDNGTEVSIGGNILPGLKLAVYGNQFNFQSDADTAMSVCNAASTAPRTALFEASNYTDGTTGTAGFRSNIARGTLLLPAAVLSGDDLGAFISRAHDGTGFFEAGRIQFDAQSNWAAGRSSSLTFSTCASGIVGDRLYISPTGNVQLATNGTSFIASGTGQGIKLPATPGNPDPNTLDAYDEGTFTPVYNGAGVAGTVTFSGRYQRTGNVISLEIGITTAAASTLTFTSATDYFDNFPAAVTPSVDTVTGSPVGDSWFLVAARVGALFRALFQKATSPAFTVAANSSVRYSFTYMI